MTRILVCGSRFSTRERPELADRVRKMIRAHLEPHGPLTVVHGAANGVDTCAGQLARETPGWIEEPWPVSREDYRWHGRRAPLLRNESMVDANVDLVLAIWNGRSRGARHTVGYAQRRGIHVWNVADPHLFEAP